MLNILIGIETDILKEIICLNVYLQNTFSCSLKITKIQLRLSNKESLSALMTRIAILPSKLRRITLAYYKEMPLMFFFVCITSGYAAWFPVQTEILFTCKSCQVYSKFFHFVCISVHFFLHRKSIRTSTFYSQS